jgi:hypothetical protein
MRRSNRGCGILYIEEHLIPGQPEFGIDHAKFRVDLHLLAGRFSPLRRQFELQSRFYFGAPSRKPSLSNVARVVEVEIDLQQQLIAGQLRFDTV